MQAYLKKVIIQKQIDSSNFLKFLSEEKKEELLKEASYLQGKRIIQVNAVEYGGGIAEILASLIPYLRSLGVGCDWYFISPDVGKRFFEITNKIHDALQGATITIANDEWDEYERVSKLIAGDLDKIDCDILAINDPQVLLGGYYSYHNRCKIYFSHIDTSSVFKPVWKKMLPLISSYRKIVFSNRNFVNGSLPDYKIKIFTPAIDPLASKQKIVPQKLARLYLKKYGNIPTDRPLIAQISRFDVWKNPMGVIQAFRMAQNAYPNALLALIGFSLAKDNPAAEIAYEDIAALASKSRGDIFLFFDPKNINTLEFVNMAQNGADIIVQNSIKEGFGLTIAEAMWKRKPVIGGPASGVRKQILDGKNGFIANTPEELAQKINFLLSHSEEKKVLGKSARRTVMKNFLFPRLLLDHIKLYRSCLK